jgi:glucose/arabinose dehydrogenase
MSSLSSLFRLTVCGCVASFVASVPSTAATLPAGFTEVLVASGLTNPTAMAIAPDGRVFVCQQGGQLRVIKDGSLLPTPFVTLTVSSIGERGLLGVAFDPAFDTNQFVYVYYTATSPNIHNRVSRFTANGDVARAGSEFILLDLEPLGATNHNGGAIHFGQDGKLYVAVGDNAVGTNSQTLSNRLGKMLRVNSNGTIPSDNPFFDDATSVNRVIWTLGLRNPFTFAVQSGSGRIFINDVGEGAWEEINDGVSGANYGWPETEGPTDDPRFKSPLYAYDRRTTDDCAISGGAFYNPATAQFPAEYVGAYFFADFCGGWIQRLDPLSEEVNGFATGISLPVDLKVADDGSLYYLARGGGGVLYRISSTDPAPSNLKVAALKAPVGAASGALIRVADTTRNEGPGDARATSTGIWLSTDNTLGGDSLLGLRAVGELSAGASSKGITTVALTDVEPGTYFLIAEADSRSEVAESNEGDNARARKLVIGPDLTVAMTISPSSPSSSSPTTITVTTTNSGFETAAPSTARLYRSENRSIGAGDALLREISVPTLAPDATSSTDVVVTLPPGTYFLIVQVDATSAVAEANEDNNVKRVKKTVGP